MGEAARNAVTVLQGDAAHCQSSTIEHLESLVGKRSLQGGPSSSHCSASQA